ncbi:hypothetical protein J6590_044763 [Homalodisca vitripennis]|nr:hypothetical protein J6590_044763 [Homalodisca vitripennis]
MGGWAVDNTASTSQQTLVSGGGDTWYKGTHKSCAKRIYTTNRDNEKERKKNLHIKRQTTTRIRKRDRNPRPRSHHEQLLRDGDLRPIWKAVTNLHGTLCRSLCVTSTKVADAFIHHMKLRTFLFTVKKLALLTVEYLKSSPSPQYAPKELQFRYPWQPEHQSTPSF